MSFWKTSKRQQRASRFAAVGVMLLLWLGVLALTASPQFHSLLHQDANSLGHHCLITQIQRHSLLAELAPVLAAAAPPAVAVSIAPAEKHFFAGFDYWPSPSRAPPSSLGSVTVVG